MVWGQLKHSLGYLIYEHFFYASHRNLRGMSDWITKMLASSPDYFLHFSSISKSKLAYWLNVQPVYSWATKLQYAWSWRYRSLLISDGLTCMPWVCSPQNCYCASDSRRCHRDPKRTSFPLIGRLTIQPLSDASCTNINNSPTIWQLFNQTKYQFPVQYSRKVCFSGDKLCLSSVTQCSHHVTMGCWKASVRVLYEILKSSSKLSQISSCEKSQGNIYVMCACFMIILCSKWYRPKPAVLQDN